MAAVVFALHFRSIGCDNRPGSRLALGTVHVSSDQLQKDSTAIFPCYGLLLVSPCSWVLFENPIVARLLDKVLSFMDQKFQHDQFTEAYSKRFSDPNRQDHTLTPLNLRFIVTLAYYLPKVSQIVVLYWNSVCVSYISLVLISSFIFFSP